MSVDDAKKRAAIAALDYVRDGMTLGLGTGSTAVHFVRALGERVRAGLKVRGVPTSEATAALALDVGVPLTTLEETPALDLGVDGADEVDHAFNLIKGGGGALLREKIVASACARFIVIADQTKWVETLGAYPLPVEVTAFAAALTARRIEAALRETGCAQTEVRQRMKDGKPYLTDGGNRIFDAHVQRIPDAYALAAALTRIPGVLEHGLFLDMTQIVILGDEQGVTVKTL